MATRSYVPLIKNAKKQGYTVVLIYFWLESSELAKARVKKRVEKGGHNIPPIIIERRYIRGLQNFFSLYKILADSWIIYDNSHESPVIMARGSASTDIHIFNDELWTKFNTGK